jgi:hypothetical protein
MRNISSSQNAQSLAGTSSAGRSCCRLPAVAHPPTVSRFVTTSAAPSEEPAVASTSQPEVFGRRQALSLLAVTPVLAQAQSAWAVQVCGLHRDWDTSAQPVVSTRHPCIHCKLRNCIMKTGALLVSSSCGYAFPSPVPCSPPPAPPLPCGL